MLYEGPLTSDELERLTHLCAMLADGSAFTLRRQAGIGTTEIATVCGVSPYTINRWENGREKACTKKALVYLDMLEAVQS